MTLLSVGPERGDESRGSTRRRATEGNTGNAIPSPVVPITARSITQPETSEKKQQPKRQLRHVDLLAYGLRDRLIGLSG